MRMTGGRLTSQSMVLRAVNSSIDLSILSFINTNCLIMISYFSFNSSLLFAFKEKNA